MSLDSITDLITLLKDLFKSGNFKTILLFGIVLFFLLLFKNLDPLQKSAVLLYNMKIQKNDLTKERNKKALQKLYLPLFQYVYPQTEISHYLPDQANKFLRDIQSIINEHPLYSTDLLNDLITQLEEKINQKKNYQYSLSQIRFYIMYEYDLLRKDLGYPTSTKKTRSLYINPPSYFMYKSAYISLCICVSSFLIIFLLSATPTIKQIELKKVMDILFAYLFTMSGFIAGLLFLFALAFNFKKKKEIKKIWITYNQQNIIDDSASNDNNPPTGSDSINENTIKDI